jgi:hypothetical protein
MIPQLSPRYPTKSVDLLSSINNTQLSKASKAAKKEFKPITESKTINYFRRAKQFGSG